MGAFDRRPQLRGKEIFPGVDPGREQPGLARGHDGRVCRFPPPAFADAEVTAAVPVDPAHGAARGAARGAGMQGRQRGALGPVRHPRGRVLPQRLGQPLRAAGDEPVRIIGVGVAPTTATSVP